MNDKERKRKKLVRALIYVFAAIAGLLVVATFVISQLPVPAP